MDRTVRNILALVIGLTIGGYCAYALAKNPIDDQCPQHVVWGAPQIKQEGNNQYICRTGYAVNYNYTTKVSYFAVESIRADQLVKNAARKDDFREDPQVPPQYRATLKDYQGSGYDRGHMAPAADLTYSPVAMSESFFLTNMMPQVPGNNRGIWKYLEEYTRFWAQKHNHVYAITGTLYDASKPIPTIGNNVMVPQYVYKIVIDPNRAKAIAFMFPNMKLDPKDMEKYIVSISEIEQYTGIDFNPMIPAQLKGIETTRSTLAEWQ
jgi:endonuclease G